MTDRDIYVTGNEGIDHPDNRTRCECGALLQDGACEYCDEENDDAKHESL